MKTDKEKRQARIRSKAKAKEKVNARKNVDYSHVTPATGVKPDSMHVAKSLANHMPTADLPGFDGAFRADPDKTIPGAEAVTGVDHLEVDSKHMGTITISY